MKVIGFKCRIREQPGVRRHYVIPVPKAYREDIPEDMIIVDAVTIVKGSIVYCLKDRRLSKGSGIRYFKIPKDVLTKIGLPLGEFVDVKVRF